VSIKSTFVHSCERRFIVPIRHCTRNRMQPPRIKIKIVFNRKLHICVSLCTYCVLFRAILLYLSPTDSVGGRQRAKQFNSVPRASQWELRPILPFSSDFCTIRNSGYRIDLLVTWFVTGFFFLVLYFDSNDGGVMFPWNIDWLSTD
jgi:hypothetical protein